MTSYALSEQRHFRLPFSDCSCPRSYPESKRTTVTRFIKCHRYSLVDQFTVQPKRKLGLVRVLYALDEGYREQRSRFVQQLPSHGVHLAKYSTVEVGIWTLNGSRLLHRRFGYRCPGLPDPRHFISVSPDGLARYMEMGQQFFHHGAKGLGRKRLLQKARGLDRIPQFRKLSQ